MAVAHRFAEKARTNDVLIAETVDFAGLCLSDSVLHGLKNSGFERPSPIQLKAIPLGRCGLDLIVQAKSGTGKTCVFSVIALESVEVSTSSTQVLVLAPTREIAIQIWEVINSLGSAMPDLQCHTFIGGLPLHEDKKKLRLCHIAVGTPGRIQSLIEQGCLKTSSIRLFVLDEADKLLEECFQEQVNWIYSALPENKQILALSATYPEYMANHLTIYMRNPTFIRLNISDLTLLGIKQYFACVASHPLPHRVFEAKTAVVVKLLSSISFDQCLIFSNMQTRAQNLENELTSQGWPTTCIAGSLDQKDRISAMAKLKAYKCRVLISTDLTSRGIDADQVNLIINLDVPKDHETYLHRIGRAGRFGSYGAGVTVVSEGQELLDLHAIEHKISAHIQSLPDPIPDDLVKQQLQVNLDDVVTTKVLVTRSQPEKQLLPDENKTKVHEDATTPLVMAEKRADDNLPSKEAFHIQNSEDSVYNVCQAAAEIPFQDSSVDTYSVGILEQYTSRSGCAESLDDYGCLSQHSDAAPDCAPIVQLDNNTISKNTSSQDSNGENSVDINSEDISGSKVNTDLLGIVDKGYSLNQDQAQETDGQENSLVLNFISLQGNQSNEGEEVTGTNDTNSQENGSSVHSYLAALVPTGNDGVCSDIPVAQSEILKMNRGKHPECEHESGQSTDSTRPNENKLDKLNDKVGKLETEVKASKEFGSSSSLQKSAVLKKYFNAFATADGWSTMLNSDAEVPASRRGISDVGEQSPKTHQNRKENGRKDEELSWESELEMYISARSKVNKDLNDDVGEDLGSHKATNMNRPKIQAKRKLGVGHSSVRQCKEEKDLNKPSVKESELETVPQQVHLSPRNGFTLTRAALPPQDSGRIVKDGKETVVNDHRPEDFNTSKDCIIKASKWQNGTDGKKITALSTTDEKWGCTTSEAVGETHETGTESVTDFLENSSLLFSLRNLGTRAKESNKNSSLLNYSSALQDYEKYLEENTKPVILTAHEFVQKTLKAKKTMDQNHLKQISNFLDHFHSSLKEKSHQTNNALPLQHDTKNSISEIRQDFGQKLLSNGPEVHAAEISQNGNSLWDGGDRLSENGYTGTPLPETINPQPIAFSSSQIEVRQDIELNLPEKPLSKRSVDSDQKTKAKAERPQRYRPMAVCGPATEHLFNFRFKVSEICLPASEDIAVSDGLELTHSEMDNQEKQEIRKNGSFTPCFDQIQLSLSSENHIPVLTATKEVEDTAYEDMNFTIPCISDQSQSRGKTYTTAVTSLNEASDDSSENSSSVSSLSASGEGNTSEEVKNKNPICFQNYYVDESAVRKGNGKPSPKPLMTKRVCNEHTGKKLDSVPSAPIQTASSKPHRKQAQSACLSHQGKDFKLNSAVPATHHFQGSEKNYHNCYNTVTETPAFWPDYTWPYSHYMAVPYSQIAQPTSLPRRTWQQYTTSPSYLQNFPVQYHDRNWQQYLHPSSSEYPHPFSTGYLHPSSTGYLHPSSTRYPHPSSTAYPHPSSTGYLHTNSTGYPHPSSTRYPYPSSTGYPHLSSTRYPHPSSTGYLHTYSTGYPHPSSTRYPHPTSSGAGARHMYTSQQLAENLAETHRVQVESLQIYIRKMAKFYATFCQRER